MTSSSLRLSALLASSPTLRSGYGPSLAFGSLRAPLAVAIASLSFACGDPLALGDFEGDALAHLEGIVCGDHRPEHAVAPTLGILWKWFDGRELREDIDNITPIAEADARFPAPFSMTIYDPPPVSRPNRYGMGANAVEADIGCPVVFDDLDGDGRFGDGDLLLAVSWDHLIVFVHEPRGVAPTGLPLEFAAGTASARGYRIVEGVCGAAGEPNTLRVADSTRVDLSFLGELGARPARPADSCVEFF